jgi:AcrR family transcriptional regulator
LKELRKLRLVEPAEDAGETDGRRRRSQDSRARIVAAMLDLVREGEVSPGAETVAARAEVGLRTVFRHFKDMDSLYGEMSHAIEGELRTVVSRPLLAETAHDRVLELIDRRSTAFEKIAPFKHAAEAHRHDSMVLAAGQVRLVTESREILQRLAPPEVLADPLKLEALDLLLSFEAWSRLRREQGLSAARTREVLTEAVRRLLDG